MPLHWNANSNLVWTTAIPGQGWASPIVWGDRVFVTTATENGTRCHVLCLDRRTGRIAWDNEVFQQVPRRKEGKNSYATPTPATDGKRVYAVFADGSIVALTTAGSLVWTNREVRYYSRHGLGASPILHNGLVILNFGPGDPSFLIAMDAASGKTEWKVELMPRMPAGGRAQMPAPISCRSPTPPPRNPPARRGSRPRPTHTAVNAA